MTVSQKNEVQSESEVSEYLDQIYSLEQQKNKDLQTLKRLLTSPPAAPKAPAPVQTPQKVKESALSQYE